MKTLKWEKRNHPLFIKTELLSLEFIPQFQWRAKTSSVGFSVLSPSLASNNLYELYDGDNIYRATSLKKAKEMAEKLLLQNKKTI